MTAAGSIPLILMVAPNGARKTKADHLGLPLSPEELATEALACRDAGAAMIHLHVRDANGRHTLDTEAYKDAILAIRSLVGDSMLIQVTTEAVGQYQSSEQMDMVRALKPEYVSLALREIIPDRSDETEAEAFILWMLRENIIPQYILYDAGDVARFIELRDRGVIPGNHVSVLFVLGRYTQGQTSNPGELMPFLKAAEGQRWHWSVCAFGAREGAAITLAACLDGHGRIGFENNFFLSDGSTAANNADLIKQASAAVNAIGRKVADADTARQLIRGPAPRIDLG